jgi:hypothetical protein
MAMIQRRAGKNREHRRRSMATEIVLEPNLTHCIETVAKSEYERVLSLLLKDKKEDPRLADELELLGLFLESADFGLLRSCCDECLIAGRPVKVIVRSTGGIPDWYIETD